MQYDRFEHLLQLKFSLLRALHEASPVHKPSIRRVIGEVDARLSLCERYGDYIREYALRVRKVG